MEPDTIILGVIAAELVWVVWLLAALVVRKR